MGRRGVLVGAVVLVGIVLWLVVRDQRLPSEEPLPDGVSAPAAPESAREPVADRPTQPETSESEREAEPEGQAAPAAPSQAAPQEPEELEPMPPPKQSGPVAELTRAFATDQRDSAAQVPESRIESEFRKSDIAPGLLKSVLCRESVCKVEVLWTPDRAVGFMSAFTRLSADFESDIAIDPHDAADARQERQVDVYLPRRAAGAKPSER